MSLGLPGALAAPSGVSGLEQSELEQTGDRPPASFPVSSWPVREQTQDL